MPLDRQNATYFSVKQTFAGALSKKKGAETEGVDCAADIPPRLSPVQPEDVVHLSGAARRPPVQPEDVVHVAAARPRAPPAAGGRDGCWGPLVEPEDKVARWQNLIPSFPWIVPGWGARGRNPRKGRDQILQRSVAEP